ncbi:hypothetical protein Sipo8835_46220 [Streptomyces ipomoeae]|jgi:hypothetical protein|uniref:Uncharacterized protein n=2 Tax=Streptomyces ipomoeae TaxID=103232 RepID=L1L2W8_9ACTN|nr:hypothetical protein [Streptomyces ipomoeae]EKX67144.1 hypothetical protein STRIP9103_03551 [Streptomyces ipomoeae 91-03]MDX2698090.1 hypothetical protein [Streptomyces ipomoeae]MDX2828553.1 hypothetical protein [Streptomyces ipomoeae]MDX2846495.1 hypothetical protein [Streptomyces ipomoeae]MDX2872547.1 hypothetical protein [Streptomyces ipomoeae]
MVSDDERAGVALELERLRRAVDVGFATTRGDLALLLQRADQTDKTLSEHEDRLDALERTRWPLPSLAALTSCAALAVTVWSASTGR